LTKPINLPEAGMFYRKTLN